jgi:hypothetical protein
VWPVHLAHATGAEGREHLVGIEFIASSELHIGDAAQFIRSGRGLGMQVVGRFEAGAGEGSLPMHTWAKVSGSTNRKRLFSLLKCFLQRSHPHFANFYARAPPSAPKSMRSRFEKSKRVCGRSERRSGPSRHQTTPFLKWLPGPFPGPWRHPWFLRLVSCPVLCSMPWAMARILASWASRESACRSVDTRT